MPATYLNTLLAIDDEVKRAEADAAKGNSSGGHSNYPGVVNDVGAGGYVT